MNNNVNAQDTVKSKPQTILRLHFLLPGAGLEQGIKEDWTCVFDLGTGYTSIMTEDENGNDKRESYFNPFIKVEPRYYYDIKKRGIRGLRTDFYSGGYFGAIFRFGIPTDKLDFWCSYGPVVGFQRTLKKRFYWNISFGVGAQTYHGNTIFSTTGDLSLGIILNKLN